GGYIVLGIQQDEQGRPVLPPRGLDDRNIDEIQREIRGQCKRIEPEYQPAMFAEVFEEKRVLVVWAPGGDNRPYQRPTTLTGSARRYFVTQGSETVEAKGEAPRLLLEQTARVPYDDRRRQDATVRDISPTLVRRFLADVRSDLVNNPDDLDIYRLLRLL